jgi:hypothetical protein
VTLEQVVTPRVMPPGPLLRMVRGMCARTVGNMMADLQTEVDRRRASEGEARGREGEGGRRSCGVGERGGGAPDGARAAAPAGTRRAQAGCSPNSALAPSPAGDTHGKAGAGRRHAEAEGGKHAALAPASPAACLTARALDLFAGAAPLQITIAL